MRLSPSTAEVSLLGDPVFFRWRLSPPTTDRLGLFHFFDRHRVQLYGFFASTAAVATTKPWYTLQAEALEKLLARAFRPLT